MKYLLIDGNNLAVRCAFANEELMSNEGIATGVHYGFLQSLISLKKQFVDYQCLIVWDGESARRVLEAQKGVEGGIVPSGYKENRDRGVDAPKPLQDFYAQSDLLKKGIGQTGIPQIRLPDFEADDVIASYANLLKKSDNEIVAVTSDNDYWQILDEKVSLWDGMKNKKTTKDSWESEYGVTIDKVVDIGALMGDSSDNIFGIPGWGQKTAIKAVVAHGGWKQIIETYHKKHDPLRKEYPDITDEKCFNELASAVSNPKNPNSRKKFPEIKFGMPFTGVCQALNDRKIKIVKSELMALVFEERIGLAYSLKKMDDDIAPLPDIVPGEINLDRLKEYMEYFDIYSLMDDIEVFEN